MELLAASCRASITRGSCLAGDGVFQVTASALVPSYKLDISLSFLSYTSIQKEPVSCKISGVMAQSNHLATFFFFFFGGGLQLGYGLPHFLKLVHADSYMQVTAFCASAA